MPTENKEKHLTLEERRIAVKGRKKAGLGTVWAQNKEESPGTLEIPGLSSSGAT